MRSNPNDSEPRKKTAKKTAAKTAKSPRNGAEIPLGAHPGNTGGKKGRSGRKADAFKTFCQNLLSDAQVQQAARKIARNPDHPAWKGAVEWLSKYGHHELVSNVDITSKGERLTLEDLLTGTFDDSKDTK